MSLSEVEPADWDELLAAAGGADVYLARDYVESACLLDPGRPAFLHLPGKSGDIAFAAIVREIPGGERSDVTTPYGYGGPVALGETAPSDGFWEAYERWCAERGIVTTFLRFHPLYENQGVAGPEVRLEELAGTVAWRLGSNDLFGGMHRSHRNKCRKAQRAGVTMTVVEKPGDLTEFAALYERTMRRQEASEFYFFPDMYWRALETALRDRIVRFDAVREGETIASALCLAAAPRLHYHLGAVLDEARALGASNLLLYEVACWAKEQGCDVFHLGGGVGGRDDSLFNFKRCFDPGGVRECWIGKAVHDERAYLALAGSASLDGFFPAYRVPGALSQTAGTPKRA